MRFASFFSGGFNTNDSNKSTGKETGKTHLCAMEGNDTVDLTSYKNGGAENKILLQN